MVRKGGFHVLHLTLSLDVGGAERVICSLVEGQNVPEIKQSVCCLDNIGRLGEGLLDKGCRVDLLRRGSGVDWKLVFRLRAYCSRNRVDLIHAHGESPWFYGALAGLLPFLWPLPCFTTIHGYGGGDRRELHSYRLWRFLTLLSRKVVLVSPALHRELLQEGFPRCKLLTIVNGLDLDSFSRPDSGTNLRTELDLKENIFILGVVARLSPVKNHALLFRAVSRLRSLGSLSLRLLVVGDGPERERLERLAEALGIEGLVVFCGEQSDVSRYYSVFDAFVLPSFSEGISMTILEAMAAGVSVVASAVGGNCDIVEDGRNGLLFPSDDCEALVAALLKIMRQPELARSLAEHGRETVATVFSRETMLQSYRALYGEILGRDFSVISG